MKTWTAFLFSLAMLFPVAGAATASCGNNICEAGENWQNTEDASTCFSDCHRQAFQTCEVDKESASKCRFNGRDYTFEIISSSSCGPDEELEVSASFDGHSVTLTTGPGEWRTLHDDVKIQFDTNPCSAYTTTYDFHITGTCDTENCRNTVDITLPNSNTYRSETGANYRIETGLQLSQDLESPVCEYILKSGENIIRTREASCGSFTFRVPVDSVSYGQYSIQGKVWDEDRQNIIAKDEAQLQINQCKTDSDCSTDACSTASCTGTPRTCKKTRKDGCSYNSQCLPQGSSVGNRYCTAENKLEQLKQDGQACTQDYQCSSGNCRSGNCYRSFLGKVQQFLADLF